MLHFGQINAPGSLLSRQVSKLSTKRINIHERLTLTFDCKFAMIRFLQMAVLTALAVAFAPIPPVSTRRQTALSDDTDMATNTALYAGGFGGGGFSKKKKGKKKNTTSQAIKFKPKQQWDRYLDMKGEDKIGVAVRCKEDESEDWLFVGYVKSKAREYTEISVALQRALIAEVNIMYISSIQDPLCSKLVVGLYKLFFSSLVVHSMLLDCIHSKFQPKRRSNGHTILMSMAMEIGQPSTNLF